MTATPISYFEKVDFADHRDLFLRVRAFLFQKIPGAANVHRSCAENDKNGTDYWVECVNGSFVSVDGKFREKDFGKKDLALETFSNVERKLPGWARDTTKRTDFVLFHWVDSGRFHLIPFVPLCRAFSARWEQWRSEFETAKQWTTDGHYGGKFTSECVFVPITVVWRAIFEDSEGIV